MSNNTTINDVAKAANVSKATVSRYLNNKNRVNPDTAEKITQVIEELNFIPNATARNLALKTTDKIGLLISGLNTPFWSNVYSAICESLSLNSTGHELLTLNSDSMILYNTKQKLQDKLQILAEMRVAGIILALRERMEEEDLNYLRSLDIPFVMVQNRIDDADTSYVSIDNFKASHDATRFLLRYGHTNIAYVMGPLDAPYSEDRFQGYKRAMVEYHRFNPENVLQGNNLVGDGYWRMKQVLSWEKRPTGVMFANDVMAYGGIKAILESGLRIPDDMSIIGFDGLHQSIELFDLLPPLNSVSLPMKTMGEQAAQILEKLIRDKANGQKRAYQQIVPTKFIDKGSCRALDSEESA